MSSPPRTPLRTSPRRLQSHPKLQTSPRRLQSPLKSRTSPRQLQSPLKSRSSPRRLQLVEKQPTKSHGSKSSFPWNIASKSYYMHFTCSRLFLQQNKRISCWQHFLYIFVNFSLVFLICILRVPSFQQTIAN